MSVVFVTSAAKKKLSSAEATQFNESLGGVVDVAFPKLRQTE